MQGQNVVQLQLPSGTRRFSFTFESDEPGPVTLEVSIRPSLKWPVLALLPAPDNSEMEPESELEDTTKVQLVFNTCIKPMGATGVSLKDLKDNIYRNQIIIVNYYMSSSCLKKLPLSPDVTFQDPHRISESPVEQEMLDYDFLTGEDLDLMTHGTDLPNLGLNFHSPKALHNAVDHFSAYNAATSSGSWPFTSYEAHHLPPDPEQHALDQQIEKAVEELHREENQLLQEAEDNLDHLNIDVDAHFDDPDEEEDMETATTNDIDEDDPDPFISNEGFSTTNDQNLADVPPHLLNIYVVVSWLHLQFHLPHVACNALLTIFACILIALAPTINVPFVTLQSSNHVLGVDTTIFTLPVCPTCCDIKSLLKIPGLEAVLDGWRSKPRTIGKYTDIFDGDTCRTKLKGPDGKLFFSNLPHEQHGPDGELHIRVNLGADWFSYIRSNITPSHSSAPTLFSICNLLPEYHILPGPKKQNPDQIQQFLQPIISDLLRLWRVGIKIPTKSCPQVVCDKPAAHKLGGLASHSHTNFCTINYRHFNKELFGHKQMKNNRNLNFVKEHATRYTQLSRLPYFNLVEQIVIDQMHNLYLGLVKTHFYNIWVQGKILCANHELDVFHDMLADIPQLWSSCLPTDMDDEILRQCVTMIKRAEADKEADAKSKAEQKATLAAVKKQGKEALEAEKAWIAHEKLALSEMKKQEKLRLAAAKQAEKVRIGIAAEKKAKAAAKKASKKRKATSQIVEDLPEGQVRPLPPPPPPPCLLPTSKLLTEPVQMQLAKKKQNSYCTLMI
ncbi:uncharacterized protein HD556DRAFT_1311011 [Suillus plorans]|uniref:Uncharacterized protein n=1 Tax=Suillus plorans TaxID=116603 RepID=A0A9P7DEN6_9AGAM|nr:uncharacterized protein HD556DRAFT_1311011 [Suillus plorans]KAG1789811.1 hypothetical protein HD556DRAFT_1311011 [Suillus plorans]